MRIPRADLALAVGVEARSRLHPLAAAAEAVSQRNAPVVRRYVDRIAAGDVRDGRIPQQARIVELTPWKSV